MGLEVTQPFSTTVILFCVFDRELGRSGFIFRQTSAGFFDAEVAYVQISLTPLRLKEVTLLRCLL